MTAPQEPEDQQAFRPQGSDEIDHLLPETYQELHRLAAQLLRRRPRQSLKTTSLIHEAYLRMAEGRRDRFESRGQFFGVAAKAMRCILVDRFRSQNATKRGRGIQPLQLDESLLVNISPSFDLIAVDEAIQRLARLDAVQSQIVELRFFGGLTVEETAEALDSTTQAVKQDWALAKAWLYRELHGV